MLLWILDTRVLLMRLPQQMTEDQREVTKFIIKISSQWKLQDYTI